MSTLGLIIPAAIGSLGLNSKTPRRIGSITANITVDEKHTDEMVISDHPVEQGSTISDHAWRQPSLVVIRCGWSNSPGIPSGPLGGVSATLQSFLTGEAGNLLQRASDVAIAGSGLPVEIGTAAGQVGTSALTALAFNTGTGKGTSLVQDVYQSILNLFNARIPFDIYTGKRVYRNMLIRTVSVETDKETENALIAVLTCREVIIVQTQVVSVGAPPESQQQPQQTSPIVDAGSKSAIPVVLDADPLLREVIFGSFPIR